MYVKSQERIFRAVSRAHDNIVHIPLSVDIPSRELLCDGRDELLLTTVAFSYTVGAVDV